MTFRNLNQNLIKNGVKETKGFYDGFKKYTFLNENFKK